MQEQLLSNPSVKLCKFQPNVSGVSDLPEQAASFTIASLKL